MKDNNYRKYVGVTGTAIILFVLVIVGSLSYRIYLNYELGKCQEYLLESLNYISLAMESDDAEAAYYFASLADDANSKTSLCLEEYERLTIWSEE